MDLGWIWTANLRPVLVELCILTGCRFDDSDWVAVEHGMLGTDSEAGLWFEYPLGQIRVTAAFEPGAAEMVRVKVEGARECEQEKIRWLGDIVRNWLLKDASKVKLL